MSKIIFLDIDGTIRDFDGYIPDSAAASIRRARENGHVVCICTGRPYFQIEEQIINIGFDGIVSASGSYVVYNGKCISHTCFPPVLFADFSNYLVKNHCIFETQYFDKSYILKQHVEAFRGIGDRIQNGLGKKAKKLAVIPQIAQSLSDIEKAEKILFFSEKQLDDQMRKQWGAQLSIVPFSIPVTDIWGGEITLAAINKAKGMQNILEAGGFRRCDTIAIGDSANDLEMLEFAGVGVAMGNGLEAVKQKADFVTDSLRENGIQRAFAKLNLID